MFNKPELLEEGVELASNVKTLVAKGGERASIIEFHSKKQVYTLRDETSKDEDDDKIE